MLRQLKNHVYSFKSLKIKQNIPSKYLNEHKSLRNMNKNNLNITLWSTYTIAYIAQNCNYYKYVRMSNTIS